MIRCSSLSWTILGILGQPGLFDTCVKKENQMGVSQVFHCIDSVSTDGTEDSCGPNASYCIDIGLDQQAEQNIGITAPHNC